MAVLYGKRSVSWTQLHSGCVSAFTTISASPHSAVNPIQILFSSVFLCVLCGSSFSGVAL